MEDANRKRFLRMALEKELERRWHATAICARDRSREPTSWKPFESCHLTDFDIRQGVVQALRNRGYEVTPETLRIYGYGDEQGTELAAFQGHVEARFSDVPETYFRDLRPDVYFWGCVETPGHFLWNSLTGIVRRESQLPADFPARLNKIDGAFCPPLGYEPEGVAHLWHCEGWTILAFWDRSVDPRRGSNSAFLMRGRHPFDEAWRIAKEALPQICRRFRFDVEEYRTGRAVPR